jgi:hypothetical protein
MLNEYCTIEIALTPLCCRRQCCCGFTRLALQELCLKAFAFIVQPHCRFCKQTATLPRTRRFHVFVALIVAIEKAESASPKRNARILNYFRLTVEEDSKCDSLLVIYECCCGHYHC